MKTKEILMFGLLTIGQMAERMGVCVATLRRWHKSGKMTPDTRTLGGHRRHSIAAQSHQRKTICYARVSCADQKDDLVRQKDRLNDYAKGHGYDNVEVLSDIGSGLNCRKKGLLKLFDIVLRREVGTLIIENKDRLLRFGADLLLRICQAVSVQVVIVDESKESSSESDLAKDVLAIIAVFSARLYGARSHAGGKTMIQST
jgi:putative resolvase